MTNELEQLKRLVEARAKATAGPWETHAISGDEPNETISRGVRQVNGVGLNQGDDGYELFSVGDTDFIALAGSTDLQAILSAWERDREELERFRAAQVARPISEINEDHGHVLAWYTENGELGDLPKCVHCLDDDFLESHYTYFVPMPKITITKGTTNENE